MDFCKIGISPDAAMCFAVPLPPAAGRNSSR